MIFPRRAIAAGALLLLCWCALPAAAQVDPRAALLERAAFDALNAGRAHDAAAMFRDALDGDPKNARLHLGAAAAALLEGRDSDAKDEAERALALDSTLFARASCWALPVIDSATSPAPSVSTRR